MASAEETAVEEQPTKRQKLDDEEDAEKKENVAEEQPLKTANGDTEKKVEEKPEEEKKEEEKTEAAEEEEEKEKPVVSGVPLICGSMNWDTIGRGSARVGQKPRKVEPAWQPQVIGALAGIRITQVVSGPCAAHSFFISEEGKIYALGRNENGQLGFGHTKRIDSATEIPFFKNMHVIGASCGRGHSVVLTEDDGAYGMGDNDMGQCGTGAATGKGAHLVTPKQCAIEQKIVQASCGFDFTLFVSEKGHVFSAGSSECGQLGINDSGEYIDGRKSIFSAITTPGRVHSFFTRDPRTKEVTRIPQVSVRYVSAGQHHCLAISTKNELFTWGFNGHGRLGHKTTEDELIPMRVLFFRPGDPHLSVRTAKCSYGGCFAVNNLGNVFCWGQNQINRLECPYPVPLDDLYGWNVHDIAPGKNHHVITADYSAIAMGKTTMGELGMGPGTKSSSRPDKMHGVDGLKSIQCAAGCAHTLLLVDDSDSEAKKLIDDLDVNHD